MKAVEEADLQKNLAEYLDRLQSEPIVVTRAGKACAVLHSVANDLEGEELAHSPDFWRMIEERRREPTMSWEDAKRELAS
jgi:antitoxin (DNA-binding transcriptional repressor) of toxin-antitoxin stability system